MLLAHIGSKRKWSHLQDADGGRRMMGKKKTQSKSLEYFLSRCLVAHSEIYYVLEVYTINARPLKISTRSIIMTNIELFVYFKSLIRQNEIDSKRMESIQDRKKNE